MLEVSGKTPEGQLVVRGVYRFYETTGLPLDVTLEYLRTRGFVPAWPTFILEAVEAGMSIERALSMLDVAIADSYGSKLRDVVVSRLSRMLKTDRDGPIPRPAVLIHLLPREHADFYERLAKFRAPSFDETMGILAAVVGRDVVKRLEGQTFQLEVSEKLPEDRLEALR